MKGSIVKRGKKWSVVVYLGKENGNKKYRWFSGYDSKKDAETALPDKLKEANAGRVVDHTKISTSEFFEQLMTDYINPNMRPGTADKYYAAIKSANSHFGKINVQKLTPRHIQQWVNAMVKDEKEPGTVSSYYSLINAAFKKGISWRIISLNPCTDITLPKKSKKHMKTLTSDEVGKLLSAADDHPIRLVLFLAASCGMRRGEILGLRWRQVDMRKQVFHIAESYTQSSQGAQLSELKTSSSYRAVDFGDAVKRELKKQRALQMEAIKSKDVIDIKDLNEDALQDLHVCTWFDLRPFNPPFISRKCKQLLQAAKLPDIRFHDLRHTHATLLLQAGVHPKVVQERLGHSKISMTLDTYSHVLPSMQKEASQLLNF